MVDAVPHGMQRKLLQQAEVMGIDASFCPVRAMLGAFLNRRTFSAAGPVDLQHRCRL